MLLDLDNMAPIFYLFLPRLLVCLFWAVLNWNLRFLRYRLVALPKQIPIPILFILLLLCHVIYLLEFDFNSTRILSFGIKSVIKNKSHETVPEVALIEKWYFVLVVLVIWFIILSSSLKGSVGKFNVAELCFLDWIQQLTESVRVTRVRRRGDFY